jgi:transposase InsO family protein
MPFRERCAMEERVAMLRDYDTGVFSVSELAARYEVSRETFHVWKRRRDSGDPEWFSDRASVALHSPHRTDAGIAERVIAMRRRFPRFGPKKVLAKLREEDASVAWPATSTVGDILKRAGEVKATPRRRRAAYRGEIVAGGTRPNEEWSIDFKGWFRTLDGCRCDPLTVFDTASRYLLAVRIVPPTFAGVRGELERLFGEIGLPAAIRSDNGPPFGSPGAGGLSRLSCWLLRLGIEVRFIPPGSPQDNGRHERMHRELKAATAVDPAANPTDLQARFDAFRFHYNEERPHEALDQTPPARHWMAPSKHLPDELPLPWYDANHEMRRVQAAGEIYWHGAAIFVSEALAREQVGVAELETGGHMVRFCGRDLGVIGKDGRFLRFAPPRARLRSAEET